MRSNVPYQYFKARVESGSKQAEVEDETFDNYPAIKQIIVLDNSTVPTEGSTVSMTRDNEALIEELPLSMFKERDLPFEERGFLLKDLGFQCPAAKTKLKFQFKFPSIIADTTEIRIMLIYDQASTSKPQPEQAAETHHDSAAI